VPVRPEDLTHDQWSKLLVIYPFPVLSSLSEWKSNTKYNPKILSSYTHLTA